MPIYQAFNPKIKAWVKYHFVKNGFRVLDVKEREPLKSFKHVLKKKENIFLLRRKIIQLEGGRKS